MEETSQGQGMAFVGENSSGGGGLVCPRMMMNMPIVSSHHHHHHQSGHHHPLINPKANTQHTNLNTSCSNTLFLPTPCTINSTSPSSSSFIMLQNSSNNTAGLSCGCCFMDIVVDNNIDNNNNNDGGSSSCSSVKAKIMAHPHYLRLLAAYVNCQKVGAPPETVARLDEAYSAAVAAMGDNGGGSGCTGEDPALDQFMEAYCEMLTKYEQELSKPFNEAMFFLQNIERQFKALTVDSPINFACNENTDRTESSEDEMDLQNSGSMIDLQAEDKDLKDRLLRKYSGYLGSLKQEFMKKRKKGKLPKEARRQLLDWWNGHYKWPYPSESQKLALAESTGLDQKQINNWFINQRKRHWKPSEDMQFVVVDPMHPHHYFTDNILGTPYPMDFSHTML